MFKAYKVERPPSKIAVLDAQAIEKVFATCSTQDGLPFDAKRETRYDGGVSYELWIGLWQKAFCENPRRAFKFLVYTGFIGGQMKDVINPIEIRTRDIIGQGNQHRRFVFNCYIIGHSNAGKSAFLDAIISTGNLHNQSLLGDSQNIEQPNRDDRQPHRSNVVRASRFRSVIDAYHPGMDRANQNQLRSSMAASAAARAGNLSDGLLKYVIYTEIPDDQIQDVLDDQEIMSKCDAIALFYENEREHIDFIKENIQKLPELVPKVLV